MEIPLHLQKLYKHWDKHLSFRPTQAFALNTIDPSFQSQLVYFIDERLSIWEQKSMNQNPPFTTDKILQTYRFCNIFREFDAQTITFHTMLKHLEDDFPLWLLNMFYCRFIARPETIEKTGLLSLNPEHNRAVLTILQSLPSPKYGTPYVFPVSTIMKSQTPNRELFITEHVPSVISEIANMIGDWKNVSVNNGIEKILPIFGFNHKFLWTEVLIDVAYQYPDHINLFGTFPIGPGSIPTLKLFNDFDDSAMTVVKLTHTKFNLQNLPTINGVAVPLSAENWEGVGCEFRKYKNLLVGKGRKRLYI